MPLFDSSSCCHCNALEGYSHLLFLHNALYRCFSLSHFFINSSLEAWSTLLLPVLALQNEMSAWGLLSFLVAQDVS